MPKVTIYMPDGLAERVRELDLSVSPICQAALREQVDRVTALRNATNDMEKVATRLRRTIARDEVESRARGFVDGAEWARDVATMGELRRVASSRRDYGRLQLPLEPFLVDYITQLWERGGYVDSEGYIEGFVEAVALVYREVLPLL